MTRPEISARVQGSTGSAVRTRTCVGARCGGGVLAQGRPAVFPLPELVAAAHGAREGATPPVCPRKTDDVLRGAGERPEELRRRHAPEEPRARQPRS